MSSARPNIVFVLCDELRQAAVGCYGPDPVITPNLDRFAKQSLVLTHCVSNQPVCTPYRGMLFTGKYPFTSGLYTNCNSHNDIHLRGAQTDLPMPAIAERSGFASTRQFPVIFRGLTGMTPSHYHAPHRLRERSDTPPVRLALGAGDGATGRSEPQDRP